MTQRGRFQPWTLLELGERLDWRKLRRELPSKTEPFRILQAFKQFDHMPTHGGGEPAGSLLPDGVDDLGEPSAKVDRLIGADQLSRGLSHVLVAIPKMPIVVGP